MAIQKDTAVSSEAAKVAERRGMGVKGEWIKNCPSNKGATERPVINLPGFADKTYLDWGEIEPFVEQDRNELDALAAEVSDQVGVGVSGDDVLDMIDYRERELLVKGLTAANDREKWVTEEVKRLNFHRTHIPVNRTSIGFWLRTAMSSMDSPHVSQNRIQVRGGVEYESVNMDLAEKQNPKYAESDAELKKLQDGDFNKKMTFEDGKYTLEFNRMYPFGTPDVTLLYEDGDTTRVLRINKKSVEFNGMGVFYKGEPTDNTFRGIGVPGNWDQNYPISPDQFYRHHVQDHAQRIRLGLHLQETCPWLRHTLDVREAMEETHARLQGDGRSQDEICDSFDRALQGLEEDVTLKRLKPEDVIRKISVKQ